MSSAQAGGAIEFTDCASAPTNECPRYDTKVWWWGPSNAEALENTEHSFIAIAPSSTMARRGSTGYGSIYGLNRTNGILMALN